jgi:hypothetical protein
MIVLNLQHIRRSLKKAGLKFGRQQDEPRSFAMESFAQDWDNEKDALCDDWK